MVYLTRVSHFNAAHRLYNKDWSDEQNFEVFGKCSNKNWHGHNYELHVTVCGEPNTQTGFVFNAKTLGDLVEKMVIDRVDHRNLNLDVDFMTNIQPSAENLAIGIWNELEPHIGKLNVKLHKVRLYETHKIYVEYFG